MRKTACWMIVAILALQVSLSGHEISTEDHFELNESNEEITNFAGRQSSINGNVTGEPDCNFTNWQGSADGLGGPVWESGNTYTMYSIVEWPANSGEFYQTQINSSGGSVEEDHWEGPCTCAKIGEHSGIVWYSSTDYNAWQIVEHDGSYWIAQDAGTMAGDEPVVGSDLWVQCGDGQEPSSNPCEDFNGYGGVAWENTTLVSAGEIYEFPAGSGEYYTVSPGISNQTVGAPGLDLDAWSEKYCSCEDIWMAAGSPAWDSNIVYDVGMMVEYPSGTGDIWMALVSQTTTGVAPDQPFADGNEWELCVDEEPSSGPCGGLTSVGVWDNLSRVSTGEIYEFPAGSGDYYEVIIQGYLDQEVSSPTIDLDVWTPVDCPCEEEWVANGEPVWDASTTYATNSVVEWPAGSSMLYIAWASPGPGDEPDTDPEWELCSAPDEPPATTPCAGLDIVGVWNSSMNVTSGEVYEYPINSGDYYQVNAGSPFWNVNAPDVDMDVWSPIDCPCKETWVANGQPTWVANTAYDANYVVQHPAGSGNLYIPLESGGVTAGGGEPGVDPHWVLCDGQEPSGNPCAGLDSAGVWDSSINITSGEIYEYPINSGTYYQVNAGSPFWNVNAPDVDMDVWSPIDCPCKETWAANNGPVWDATIDYPGNYVVEWPAGTGNLYIPLEPLGVQSGAEPGVDIHWVLCNGNGANPGPCDGLNVPVWDNTTDPVVGDIYEYPANSGDYYQIIFTHEDVNGGPDWIAKPVVDGGVDEFWVPYSCPCKTTWVANGQPVWDDTISIYSGNYVVEWPAGSGALYISEAGGLSASVEPGTDGHWIPCEGNPEADADADSIVPDEESIPSIGVALTLVGVLSAASLISRSKRL